jgi:hypothetical protein
MAFPKAHAAWLVPFALLAANGCKGPPPDKVRLELPELVTATDPLKPTVHVRRGASSDVANEKMGLSVVPPDVASVTPQGNLVCSKTGDARVTVDIQGVRDTQPLKCRLVERLVVDDLPSFDLAGQPVVLPVQTLAKGGAELNDVPIVLTTDSPRVMTVSGNTLTPHAVGNTNLTIAAGGKKQSLPVRVIRTVTTEALPLEGGRRIYFSLSEGKYEVEIRLASEKKLKVEWRGAPYCTYEGTGRTHTSSCVLQHKGGAVVDNPAFLLSGSTEVSAAGISLREIP